MLNQQCKYKILRKFVDWCLQYYVLLNNEDLDLEDYLGSHVEEDVISALRANNIYFTLENQEFIPVDWEDFLLGFELLELTPENIIQSKDFIDNYYYEQKKYIKYLFLSVFDCTPL